MRRRLAAIGIDAPHSQRFHEWVINGSLPVLGAILKKGCHGVISHTKRYRNERCWDILLSGRESHHCGSYFAPQRYDFFNESLQRGVETLPFYSLGDDYKVCMFDLPAGISPQVDGIQISGWASEMNAVSKCSSPPELLSELEEKYGEDPKLTGVLKVLDPKTGELEKSYVVPSLYDESAVLTFRDNLIQAVVRRTDICIDLLSRNHWDLFLSIYAESHTANHILWHLGNNHPLNSSWGGENVVLEVLQAIDAGIGRISEALPKDTNLLVYSIDHTAENTMDVASMALLPEFLYRWNFPGCQALAPAQVSDPVPVIKTDYRRHWKYELWQLVTEEGKARLISPYQQEAEGDALSWNPASWYKSLWPQMKAFALPSVSDGYIRLNVSGREASGIVDVDEYHKIIDQLVLLFSQAVNPRTGGPIVARTIRTRKSPFDSPEIPADLIVCWDSTTPADTLDSGDVGRIGPLPFFRSGGHVSHGSDIENLFVLGGPDVSQSTRARSGHLKDLPATLLDIIGASRPPDMDGHSLLDKQCLTSSRI